MRFWDSSALASLLIQEKATPDCARLFSGDPSLAAWWATLVEGHSAIRRAIRAGRLPAGQFGDTEIRLISLLDGAFVIPPSEPLRQRARGLLDRHPLSAADAFQLAAAILWSGSAPAGFDFVCLDDRLRAAAQAEGFRVLPA